jgi:hypothetical protein
MELVRLRLLTEILVGSGPVAGQAAALKGLAAYEATNVTPHSSGQQSRPVLIGLTHMRLKSVLSQFNAIQRKHAFLSDSPRM